MFKRIKNLLDLSRYTVEELTGEPEGFKFKEFKKGFNLMSPDTKYTVIPFNPATIVDLKGTNPFDEYETTEQSPNDTTPRNG